MLEFLLDTFKKDTLARRLMHAKSIVEFAQIIGADDDIYYVRHCPHNNLLKFNLNFRGVYVYAILQNDLFKLEQTKISGLCEKMFNNKDIYIIFVSDYQFETYDWFTGAPINARMYTIRRRIENLHLALNKYNKKLILNKPQYFPPPKGRDIYSLKLAILDKFYNKICNNIPQGNHLVMLRSHEKDTIYKAYKFKKISYPGFHLRKTISVLFPFDESNYDETIKWYEEILKEK